MSISTDGFKTELKAMDATGYMDEVNLMASQVDTPEWDTLCINLQNRLDEVNIVVAQKTKTEAPAKDAPTTPAA